MFTTFWWSQTLNWRKGREGLTNHFGCDGQATKTVIKPISKLVTTDLDYKMIKYVSNCGKLAALLLFGLFLTLFVLLPHVVLLTCVLVCQSQRWTYPTTILGITVPELSLVCLRRTAPWWASICQETVSPTGPLNTSAQRWSPTPSCSTSTSATTLWESVQVAHSN